MSLNSYVSSAVVLMFSCYRSGSGSVIFLFDTPFKKRRRKKEEDKIHLVYTW